MIDEAVRIAREAGDLLMARFGRLRAGEIVRHGRRDVVTAADREAEQHIAAALARITPDVPVWGEEAQREMRGAGAARPPAGPLWIVDPLDGTVNFVQGIPLFAVSIGLVEDGVPVLGVVHAPALGETFHGALGSGAFAGARQLSVSVCPTLENAILATGFAYTRNDVRDDNLDNVVALGRQARGIRRMGAAALDLAYVAAGRLDAFWELHLSPWDVAAGAALVRAAGGQVTDLRGGEDWLHGGHIVASNGMLHEPLQGALAPLRDL